MWGPAGNVSLCIPPPVATIPVGRIPFSVNILSCSAFGLLAVHPFAGVVFGPDQAIEDECPDDGGQGEQDRNGACHPRKMSTKSLAPAVASR